MKTIADETAIHNGDPEFDAWSWCRDATRRLELIDMRDLIAAVDAREPFSELKFPAPPAEIPAELSRSHR